MRSPIFLAALILLFACAIPTAVPPTPRVEPLAPTATAALAEPASPTATTEPVAPTVAATPANLEGRPVVIDTDMAIDDWQAILYLLQRPEVSVVGIAVAGTGEAHCEPGVRHALGLVALAGGEAIPVACGRETPLAGSHTFPQSFRDNVDNLAGLTLPAGENPAGDETAVDLLESLLQSSPVKVTLLALGPLTNVAEALQRDPALAANLEMIYIMGGAVDVPGNIASVGADSANTTAEWNIYIDPAAANIVFASGAPITLIPLDATNQTPLSQAFYTRLEAAHATPEATFVYDLYRTNRWLIDSGTIYFWDQLAAAILTDESLATFAGRTLCVVEAEGPESGRTQPGADCPAVRVAVSADAARFEQVFLATLNQ